MNSGRPCPSALPSSAPVVGQRGARCTQSSRESYSVEGPGVGVGKRTRPLMLVVILYSFLTFKKCLLAYVFTHLFLAWTHRFWFYLWFIIYSCIHFGTQIVLWLTGTLSRQIICLSECPCHFLSTSVDFGT